MTFELACLDQVLGSAMVRTRAPTTEHMVAENQASTCSYIW